MTANLWHTVTLAYVSKTHGRLSGGGRPLWQATGHFGHSLQEAESRDSTGISDFFGQFASAALLPLQVQTATLGPVLRLRAAAPIPRVCYGGGFASCAPAPSPPARLPPRFLAVLRLQAHGRGRLARRRVAAMVELRKREAGDAHLGDLLRLLEQAAVSGASEP